MAMVANSPMITTTMSSSISVKPFRDITADPPGAKGRRAQRNREPDATYSERQGPNLQDLCSPLGINPIHSNTDTYDQWDAQLGGTLHMAFYQVRGDLLLSVGHLKHKLVMDLQDHAGCESAVAQRAGDADHGDLDQVRRRALQRRVGGGALTEGADVEVAVFQLRDITPPAEQGLHVAPLPGRRDGAIEPGAHAREAREVLVDEPSSIFLGDAQLAGERERTLAVDGAEIDGLGARPHLGGHLVLRYPENDGRG